MKPITIDPIPIVELMSVRNIPIIMMSIPPTINAVSGSSAKNWKIALISILFLLIYLSFDQHIKTTVYL